MEQNKVFSILFLCNYINNSPSKKWVAVLNTLKNNLLGIDPEKYAKFDYMKNLPELEVSALEITETVEDALDYLSTTPVDVIIVEDSLRNPSDSTEVGIGVATLKKLKDKAPKATIIILLADDQKKGAITQSGHVSPGRKVASLYNEGYYNGLFKGNLDIPRIFRIILGDKISAEEAAINYGLVVLPSDDSNADVEPMGETTEIDNSDENIEETADEGTSDPVSDKLNEVDALIKSDTSITEETSYEGSDIEETDKTDYSEPDVEEKTMVENNPNPNDREDHISEADLPSLPKNRSVKMNYVDSVVSFVQGETIILKTGKSFGLYPVDKDTIMNYPVAVAYLRKEGNTERVAYNVGNITFIQDDTIILKSQKPFGDSALANSLLVKQAAYVPFPVNRDLKEGTLVDYTFLTVTFVQDDTVILHSKKPLNEQNLTTDTIGNSPIYLPRVQNNGSVSYIKLYKSLVTFVQDDTVIVKVRESVPANFESLVGTVVAVPYYI